MKLPLSLLEANLFFGLVTSLSHYAEVATQCTTDGESLLLKVFCKPLKMSTQKAVIIQGPRKASFVTDRDIPKLRPSYMLVRVAAVALNPTDWKHVDFLATENALLGVDYAGTVEETGTGYSKQWEKGDRVYGFVHGGDSTQLENGAFAEHIVVKADIQLRVPPEMSFEAAATAGLGIITVGQGLFQAMKLNLPSSPANEAKPILIYGGSSGLYLPIFHKTSNS